MKSTPATARAQVIMQVLNMTISPVRTGHDDGLRIDRAARRQVKLGYGEIEKINEWNASRWHPHCQFARWFRQPLWQLVSRGYHRPEDRRIGCLEEKARKKCGNILIVGRDLP